MLVSAEAEYYMKQKTINLMAAGALAFAMVSCSSLYSKHLAGAESGIAEDQYVIGTCYLDGDVPGGMTNKALAAEWFLKAAQQGNVKAQNALGMMYEKGDGMPQSDEKAIEWYKRAALKGYSEAQYNLGHYYSTLDKSGGFDTDSEAHRIYTRLLEEAAKWYRMAAVQNHADAQFELGRIYSYAAYNNKRAGRVRANLGGDMNDYRAYRNEALEWLRKAAAQGNPRHIENYQYTCKNSLD